MLIILLYNLFYILFLLFNLNIIDKFHNLFNVNNDNIQNELHKPFMNNNSFNVNNKVCSNFYTLLLISIQLPFLYASTIIKLYFC
jgi:hypothetical protein